MYDWLLFLHVLGAFAIVATLVFYGIVVAARQSAFADTSRFLRPVGFVLFQVGGALTLVFGVWLAIYVDGYELWDGWILAALVLWFVSAEVGRRLLVAVDGGDRRWARVLYALLAVIVAAFLLLMIYKPGA